MDKPVDFPDMKSFSVCRRQFIGGMGIGLLAFLVLESRESLRAVVLGGGKGRAFRILTPGEAVSLDAWGETLLPGAAAAGLARYVDRELAGKPEESRLIVRYLDVPPPFARFYRAGLASVDAAARTAFGLPFLRLSEAQKRTLAVTAAVRNPAGWTAPEAPLFYYATLNDAADVVQGPLGSDPEDLASFRPLTQIRSAGPERNQP